MVADLEGNIENLIEAYDNHVAIINGEIDRSIYGGTAILGSPTQLGNTKLHLPTSKKLAKAGNRGMLTGTSIDKTDLTFMQESMRDLSNPKRINKVMAKALEQSVSQGFFTDLMASFDVRDNDMPGRNGAKFNRAKALEFFNGLQDALLGMDDKNAAALAYIRSFADPAQSGFGKFDDIVAEFVMSDADAQRIVDQGATTSARTNEILRLENLLAKVNKEIISNEAVIDSLTARNLLLAGGS
jgi:hypothetical protein